MEKILSIKNISTLIIILTFVFSLYSCSSSDDNNGSSNTPSDQYSDNTIQLETYTNSYGMKFVKIPAGTFMMGSEDGGPDQEENELLHEVTLTKDFFIQTTEVTQDQWVSVMNSNPSNFKDCGGDCPVESVTWYDTQTFIAELNEELSTTKYRLPTEAEWEYSARAGTTTLFAFGNCLSSNDANFNGAVSTYYNCPSSISRGGTIVGASLKANAWGLYDMHGNVSEWCQDWYQKDYPAGPLFDPTGPDTVAPADMLKIVRGGGWNNSENLCRSTSRTSSLPIFKNSYLGFRLAFFVEEKETTIACY